MAQPSKIDELRARLKADPKSRLFFPLAEELRKATQLGEAEQVLRTGLTSHPTYLSAWVSLGRVLRDQQKHGDAVEPLAKALQLDPENVVAARLLADAYLAVGEKVEAIKKYKLVHALLPADEEVEAIIERLAKEMNNSAPASEPEPEPEPEAAPQPPPAPAPEPAPAPSFSFAPSEPEETAEIESPFAAEQTNPEPLEPPAKSDIAPVSPDGDVFDITYSRLQQGMRVAVDTGDAEPMLAAHDESPFEEPAADMSSYSADAFAIEQPGGIHVATTPMAAELPSPLPLPDEGVIDSALATSDESDAFEPDAGGVAPGFIQGAFTANVPPPPPADDDFARTITMADLYAEQGLIDEARDIYEDILARDPDNATVLDRMRRLESAPAAPQPSYDDEMDAPAPLADFEPEPAPAMRAAPIPLSEPEPEPEEESVFEAAPASEPEPQPEPMGSIAAERSNPKIEKLEAWLARVGRKEAGRV